MLVELSGLDDSDWEGKLLLVKNANRILVYHGYASLMCKQLDLRKIINQRITLPFKTAIQKYWAF